MQDLSLSWGVSLTQVTTVPNTPALVLGNSIFTAKCEAVHFPSPK